MTNTQSVMQLYTAYFNRVADKAGVDYWVGEMETKGWSLDDVAQSFADQTEYTSLYNGLSNTQVVEKVYQNVLNRDGEADGIEYWSGELEKGSISVSQLVQAVVNSATEKDDNGNYVNETDGVLFTNKISVSQYAYDNNVNAIGINVIYLTNITIDIDSISILKSNIDEVLNETSIDNTVIYNNETGYYEEIGDADYLGMPAEIDFFDGVSINGRLGLDDLQYYNNGDTYYIDGYAFIAPSSGIITATATLAGNTITSNNDVNLQSQTFYRLDDGSLGYIGYYDSVLNSGIFSFEVIEGEIYSIDITKNNPNSDIYYNLQLSLEETIITNSDTYESMIFGDAGLTNSPAMIDFINNMDITGTLDLSEPSYPNSNGGTYSNDTYAFMATSSGTFTATINSNYTLGFQAWEYTENSSGQLNATNTLDVDSHILTFDVLEGNTYGISVFTTNLDTNKDYSLNLHLSETQQTIISISESGLFGDAGVVGTPSELDFWNDSSHVLSIEGILTIEESISHPTTGLSYSDDVYAFTASKSGTFTATVSSFNGEGIDENDILLSASNYSRSDYSGNLIYEDNINSIQDRTISFDVIEGQIYGVNIYQYDNYVDINYTIDFSIA